jgi:hypothetical protein
MEILENWADHIQYIQREGDARWMLTLWAECDPSLHIGIWFKYPVSYRVIICHSSNDEKSYNPNQVNWMPANWTGVL